MYTNVSMLGPRLTKVIRLLTSSNGSVRLIWLFEHRLSGSLLKRNTPSPTSDGYEEWNIMVSLYYYILYIEYHFNSVYKSVVFKTNRCEQMLQHW